MPFALPDLPTVRRQNRDFLAAFLEGADASVPNSALRVLSDQNAGGAFLNLKYLQWLAKNFLPDLAEKGWLDRWANILFGGRKAATFASGTATVTGTPGVTLAAGSILATSDGIQYQTAADVILSAAATPVAVTCLTAGAIGNRDPGALLSLTVAVSSINAQATVVLIDGGADTESDDDLRVRILLRIRNPPMGGCATDYEQWTLSLPGVSRVWVAPMEMGIGTVTVRFACDVLRASNDGLPTPDDCALAKAYLDTVRPVTVADLFVLPTIPQGIVPWILNLTDTSASTKLAIEVSLQAMLLEKATPGQTIFACWISDAITDAVGDATFDLASGDFVMANAGSIASLRQQFGGGIAFT